MAGKSSYTKEKGELICERISTCTLGIRKICVEFDVSMATIFNWLNSEPTFLEQYTRAKELQADLMVDEMIEISDDTTNDTIDGMYGPVENKEWVNRSKLRVETRKWIASKLKPKKYGDKLDVTSKDESINTQVFKIGDQEIKF